MSTNSTREVSQSSMYAFIEVGDIIFGERSKLVVDPSDERLKAEFSGVKRTYIPMHAVIRIDEVDKEGQNKIIAGEGGGKVASFPIPMTLRADGFVSRSVFGWN